MITAEEYELKLEEIADELINSEKQPAKYLEQQLLAKDPLALDLFEFRKYFLDSHDFEKIAPYEITGFYANASKEERVTYFCLEFELESVLRRKRLVHICKKYDDKQTIFESEPRLLDHIRIKGSRKRKAENELIDYKSIQQLHTSEIAKFDQKFVKMCAYLNPRIPEWISKTFSACPIFVRINPDVISDTRLLEHITEELQVNPYKIDWGKFSFTPRLLSSREFRLDNIVLSKETSAEYWDANVRKIKSLEISTSRKLNYRSFMIEELNDKDGEDGILVGRCIHFDCEEFNENALDTQILSHLDLAINVYEKETRVVRLNESLKDGKIIDANFRTHILRIDNVPLKAMPVLCLLFLRSTSLTSKHLQEILR